MEAAVSATIDLNGIEVEDNLIQIVEVIEAGEVEDADPMRLIVLHTIQVKVLVEHLSCKPVVGKDIHTIIEVVDVALMNAKNQHVITDIDRNSTQKIPHELRTQRPHARALHSTAR